MKLLSRVRLFATPWTIAWQAPLSMGFSRQEYWSGLPFPSPGDLPKPGIEPESPTLQADTLSSEPPGKPSFKLNCHYVISTHCIISIFLYLLTNFMFVGHYMAHPDEGFKCTWNVLLGMVFCRCQVKLVDCLIQVFYILLFCLLILPIVERRIQ